MTINATITQTNELTIRSPRRHQPTRTVVFSSISSPLPVKKFRIRLARSDIHHNGFLRNPKISQIQGRWRNALLLRHPHLSRKVVAQAVDLVSQLAEKRQMTFFGRCNFADDFAVRNRDLLFLPLYRPEVRRR